MIHPDSWLSIITTKATIILGYFSLSNGRDFFIDQNKFSFISISSRRNEVLKFFVLLALGLRFFLFGISLADIEDDFNLIYTVSLVEIIAVIIPFLLTFTYVYTLIRDDVSWTIEKTSDNCISFSLFKVFNQSIHSNVFTSQFNSFSISHSPYKSLFSNSFRKYFHRNKMVSFLTVSLSSEYNYESTNNFTELIILFID